MPDYEYLNHTADVGFRAYGETPIQAFQNATVAFMNLMVDPKTVRAMKAWDVVVEADDLGALLVAWLNELIYLFESERAVIRQVKVYRLERTGTEQDGAYQLQGTVRGEPFDPARHEMQTQPKACTYHMLEVKEQSDGTWVAQAILDV